MMPSEELQAAANAVHSAATITLSGDGAAALATLLARQANYARQYEGPHGRASDYDAPLHDALHVARAVARAPLGTTDGSSR